MVVKASCIVSTCVSSGADIISKNSHSKVVFLDKAGTARVAESCNTVVSALERNKLGIVCLVGDVQQFSAQDTAWEVHWSDSTGILLANLQSRWDQSQNWPAYEASLKNALCGGNSNVRLFTSSANNNAREVDHEIEYTKLTPPRQYETFSNFVELYKRRV